MPPPKKLALRIMRPLTHLLILIGFASICVNGVAGENSAFRLERPVPQPLLKAPPLTIPQADPNVLDTMRMLQDSPYRSRGIVGRNDGKIGIGFQENYVRPVAASAQAQNSNFERIGIAAALGAFAISGCWALAPRKKKLRRKSLRPVVVHARSRSRFSY